jgi:dephospho-CoA kinase
MMRILGLTGSIGMGKSTAAAMFRRDGIAVHDADAVVHDLLRRGGAAVPAVEAAFPGVVRDGAVDRRALGARVFGDPAALRRLEAILHPLVRRRLRRFLLQAGRRGDALVVLDIPLLFETRGERFCDGVAVVSAPRLLQRQRVLARPGMTPEKFAAILAAQMPDRDKRRRADWVVPTGLGRRASRLALRAVRRQALARPGRRWRPSMKVV